MRRRNVAHDDDGYGSDSNQEGNANSARGGKHKPVHPTQTTGRFLVQVAIAAALVGGLFYFKKLETGKFDYSLHLCFRLPAV